MTIMKTKDFELVDITEQFSQYDGYMNKGYVATNGNYNIEFYVLSSIDNAVKMYNTNKSNFEAQKGNKSTSSSNSFKNSSQYSLTTNGKYKHLSRIDNTFLYLNIDEIYKTEVIEILQELGY